MNLYRGKSLIVFSGILLLGFIFLAEFRTILPFKNLYHIPGTKYFIVYFNLFLFRALPFFLIGLCYRIYQDKIKSLKVKSRPLIILAFLGGLADWLVYLNINYLVFVNFILALMLLYYHFQF